MCIQWLGQINQPPLMYGAPTSVRYKLKTVGNFTTECTLTYKGSEH